MQYVTQHTTPAESPGSAWGELAELTTEAPRPDLMDLDTLSTAGIAAIMNRLDQDVPRAVADALPQIVTAIDAIVERMRRGGRLIYVGAGTPGRLGIVDASECPPTFNTDPGIVIALTAGGDAAIRAEIQNAEDDAVAGAADLAALDLREHDSVVGISASGRTPYVVGALAFASANGALSVAVASNRSSSISSLANHAIEVVVGPELITGSTRLKSGTAQKLVLNMISTISMVKLGKTYGNLMVDVQATNEKLRGRARRLVETITGVSATEAARAIDAAGGSAKLAILMLETGQSAADAAQVLAAVPSLRKAICSARSAASPSASSGC
jgi:N-acetylmuramic acid 6-phosphate etherase